MRMIIAICAIAFIAAGCGGPQPAPVTAPAAAPLAAPAPQPQPMVAATGPALTETIDADVARYLAMDTVELEAKVKELQAQETQATALLANAQEALAAATAAYDGAADADKPNILVKKLEAESTVKAAGENQHAVQKDFFAAQEAYKRKLAEQAKGN
jgi:hypothetical protein